MNLKNIKSTTNALLMLIVITLILALGQATSKKPPD
jgi:hypothetical protein